MNKSRHLEHIALLTILYLFGVCFKRNLVQNIRHLYFFFFNDTATTEIYTLSLHDALPISTPRSARARRSWGQALTSRLRRRDRKSTRLNSSHEWISYAVFCLKKQNETCIAHRLSAYVYIGESTPAAA